MGVVLAQNGVRVLDPLYRQLEVWEDGSFEDAFVDVDALTTVKYEMVSADDVEDTESISSHNDRGVPVVLIRFSFLLRKQHSRVKKHASCIVVLSMRPRPTYYQ